MIDAHCHLDEFENIPETIATAKQSGVTHLISCGTGMTSIQKTLELTEKYPEIYVAVGLGYSLRSRNLLATQKKLFKLLNHPRVAAIGECGLDYPLGITETDKNFQKDLFKMHVELAEKSNLPLVIHSRNAHEDISNIVKPNMPAQAHCFVGTLGQMHDCVTRGWYISFGGILTFKKSVDLREVAGSVPNDRLLIETDSPYLSPEPFRGQPNNPSNVRIVAEALAEIKQTSLSEIDALTTANTKSLFSKISI
jgi:TatD DNase family protein